MKEQLIGFVAYIAFVAMCFAIGVATGIAPTMLMTLIMVGGFVLTYFGFHKLPGAIYQTIQMHRKGLIRK